MSELHSHLSQIPSGPVKDIGALTRLLVDEWSSFQNSDLGGMHSSKFYDTQTPGVRCEAPVWTPPFLSFQIERHGAVVLGSETADVQHWKLDLTLRTATLVKIGKRRLNPNRKNFMTAKVADQVVQEIVDHKNSPHLHWLPDGRVKIRMNMLVDGGQQVRAYRQKHLTDKLKRQLDKVGWDKIAPATFRKRAAEGSESC